ncbi:hypothetical protein [Stutzerimonas nitrititolerans]|uniref:hypothetical protein n=1 Tax=Stutzerimonas nitrititolerans TaxID=2482751 RepID=UPI0028AD47C7|nr:hypothetical protein [Stutzerimonas nitrititolerans]
MMEALNLPESITVRFRAHANGNPELRQLTREALAKACEGHPVEVIEGFTGIKAYDPHRSPAEAKKASKRHGYTRSRKPARLVTDDVLTRVGGDEALARYLGVSRDAVKRWGSVIPERHELNTRELLRNWRKISLALPVIADGLGTLAAARAAGIPHEELLSLCDRFNLPKAK